MDTVDLQKAAVPPPAPWYTKATFFKLAVAGLLVFIVAEGWMAIVRRENDFAVHYRFGEAFRERALDGVACEWYPLGRIMFNAALAELPYRAARALCYAVAIGATLLLLRLWDTMAGASVPLGKPISAAAMLFAVGSCFTLVQRDLDDCGLQLLLLFLLSLAAFAVWRRWPVRAGLCLAAAVTYKSTPLLFLPLLIWKRRWTTAAWTVVFTVLINLLPALYLGWRPTLDYHQRWYEYATASAQLRDPSLNVVEPPKPQNQSLQAGLARYLMTFPDDHLLYVDHPLFMQFGRLSAASAHRVVQCVLLVLAAALAWRFRKPWSDDRHGDSLPIEWAVCCVFCALLSPLCWKHHLVLMLPCIFLAYRHLLGPGLRGRWQTVALAAAVILILFSARGVVGRELSIVLMSYKTYCAAALLTVGLTLSLRLPLSQEASTARRERKLQIGSSDRRRVA